jgi:hypothetical protein
VGLVFAGALAVLEAAQVDALQVVTTIIAAALLIYTRVSVFVLMGIAAVLFAGLTFV